VRCPEQDSAGRRTPRTGLTAPRRLTACPTEQHSRKQEQVWRAESPPQAGGLPHNHTESFRRRKKSEASKHKVGYSTGLLASISF
jgi:hypothetical protein